MKYLHTFATEEHAITSSPVSYRKCAIPRKVLFHSKMKIYPKVYGKEVKDVLILLREKGLTSDFRAQLYVITFPSRSE